MMPLICQQSFFKVMKVSWIMPSNKTKIKLK